MSTGSASLDLPLDLPPESRWAKAYKYAHESVRRFQAQSMAAGGIVREVDAAKIAGTSRQRIAQLIEEGRVRRVEVRDADGELLAVGVGLNSLLEWRRSVRGFGPKKVS